MAHLNLLVWDNGRGLSHDLSLFQQTLLGLGHQVEVTRLGPGRSDGKWAARRQRLKMALAWALSLGKRPARFDVNIALEQTRPHHLGLARINLIAPHPEWFPPRSQRYLPRYDAVLCKTLNGMALFEPLARRAILTGFISTDCLDRSVERGPGFLHICGASKMKGTERLAQVWARHPQWPLLTILCSADTTQVEADNIRYLARYVPLEELRQLQNSHAFHVCLSEAEGWGHYIAEAMSCGAVVLTTDAGPMNELITRDCGVVVKASPAGTCQLSTLYHFDEADLEAAIERLLVTPAAELAALGQAARARFDAFHQQFPHKLEAALAQLL